MKVFLAFFIQEITPEGEALGITKEWAIFWTTSQNVCLLPGDRYLIYPRGSYHDVDIDSIMVTMVKENDPSITYDTEMGGFDIPEMPLWITTRADVFHPAEGGIRAQTHGWIPWSGTNDILGIATVDTLIQANDYHSPDTPAC